MINSHVTEILKLSLEERIKAAELIWDSIEGKEMEDVSPEQLNMLEERLEEYKRDPSIALTWEEHKERVAAAKRK